MQFLVDVELKYSTIELVRILLQGPLLEGTIDNKHLSGDLPTFMAILDRAIIGRLNKLGDNDLHSLVILSKNMLEEGQGSMEISDPPTQPQMHIIKSLLRVIFHQIKKDGLEFTLEDGQSNLILSLFVDKISVEDCFTRTFNVPQFQDLHILYHNITNLLNEKTIETHAQHQVENMLRNYSINTFCCLQDLSHGLEEQKLSEEFDKIDLENSLREHDFDEETLASCSNYPNKIVVPFSKQVQQQVHVTFLPSRKFEGLWESLQFEDGTKKKIFSYATMSLKMSSLSRKLQKNIKDNSILSSNKLLLVYGPPGTGKTSICRALCQKLSIRNDLHTNIGEGELECKCILIELTCSNVFSRWFGESSKNVSELFNEIEQLLKLNADKGVFVCILIDEVEAIASSRTDILGKNEATDGVRVVNTLLTHLDKLKQYNNFLVLSTSNLLNSIDPAFLDRADGKFYLGNPSETIVYNILKVSLRELIETGILKTNENLEDLEKNIGYIDILRVIAKTCFVCYIFSFLEHLIYAHY